MERINFTAAQKIKYEQSGLPVKRPVYELVKRIFDIIFSLAASVMILIPGIIVSAVIFLADPGSPLFTQERVGLNGKNIRIVKFRSMVKYADDLKNMLTSEQYERYLKEFKLEDDPRLLPHGVGRILRSFSIDEIPQLPFNVLKGDISIVGPRPILRDELENNYTPEEQRLLLSIKPGLTGYWQAYGRNSIGYKNRERQSMEMYYVKNRGIWFDIKIILKTITAVIGRKGAQ